jgi:ABC-type transporter Mla subunit MlaD
MSIIGIGMDILLAILLLAAIGFGFRLERKLKTLRNGQEAFAQAVRELDAAARRAESGLANLRAATDEAHDSLHDRILKARELKTQLDGQIARAERLGPTAPKAAPPSPEPAAERPRFNFRPAAAPPKPDRPAARRFDEELFDIAGDRG